MYKKYIYYGIAAVSVIFLVGFYVIQKNQAREIEDLINILKSEDGVVRERAMNEIPRYNNKAIKPLTKLLMENQNKLILSDVIQSLGQIKSAEAALALIRFFQQIHKMPNEITWALENIGRPAVEPLFKAYDSTDYYTKTLILSALNNLNGKFLTDKKFGEDFKKLLLKAFLYDGSSYVKKTALPYLGQFENDPEVTSVLKMH